jgi:hypothetical protein
VSVSRESHITHAVGSGVRTMSWRSKEMVPEIQEMTMQSRRRHAGSRARAGVSVRTWLSRA